MRTTNPSLLPILLSLGLLCGLACESQGQPSDPAGEPGWQRHQDLQGQSNFRDLGGYQTSDGRTVKTGVLYRSGELSRLTDADLAVISGLNIQTVVNFLSPNEIASRGGDRLPDGVQTVDLPVDPKMGQESIVDELILARKNGDFSKVPATLNPEFHRVLPLAAREQYAALIRSVIDGNSLPLVFHCSHGVHRTGTASAILLSALGVPWKTVRADYLLSNTYRNEEVQRRLAQLRGLAATNQGIPIEDVDTTNMTAFYVLAPAYIDGTLEIIQEKYGSMDRYLTDGLGLTSAEIDKLRSTLLE